MTHDAPADSAELVQNAKRLVRQLRFICTDAKSTLESRSEAVRECDDAIDRLASQGSDARDAARYRWLRTFSVIGEHLYRSDGKIAWFGDHEGLDAVIDAAMGETK